MSYYDQPFKPWDIVDGQCLVADEAEWRKLQVAEGIAIGEKNLWSIVRDSPCICTADLMPILQDSFESLSGWLERMEQRGVVYSNEGNQGGWLANDWKNPIVKVPTDIFEDVEGPVICKEFEKYEERLGPLTVSDLIDRTLQTVDATPHVDYLIVTQRPELVREKWILAYPPHSHDWPKTNGEKRFRRNVILAVPVETQADIERLVTELAKCHDICKGLAVVCNPKEELDFRKFVSGLQCDFCGPVVSRTEFDGQCNVTVCESCFTCFDDAGSTVTGTEAAINRIIAEGNEHPIHPDWLRSLRDQCLDANVPFNFAGWGDWVPRGDFGKANRWTRTQIDPVLKGSINGEFSGEYETLYPWQESVNNPCMIRGYQRSGRLLDGVEHNGRIGG